MSSHILISRSHRFPIRGSQPDDNSSWIYDRSIGAWRCRSTGLLMLEEATHAGTPAPPPRPPRPVSKKADIETGEDMKGE